MQLEDTQFDVVSDQLLADARLPVVGHALEIDVGFLCESLELARLCRKVHPEVPIVMGGNHASMHPETLLDPRAPFEGEEFWCDGCRLTLLIENSLFEAPITDGIQLINFGSNTTMNVTIRGTTVLRPKPQQVGGGISLWSQTEQNSGNRVQLKVEQSQVIGSSGYSVAVRQQGDDAETIVDLGGGSLDAAGNNRFVDNAAGALSLEGTDATARNNWWGRTPPKVTVSDGNSVDLSEPLARDPGS